MPEHVADEFCGTDARSISTARAWRKTCGPRFPGGSTPAAANRPRIMPYRFVIAI
jgi:hypothetical protein